MIKNLKVKLDIHLPFQKIPTIKLEKSDTIENLWRVDSFYEFYYFNCPSCPFKHGSKQDFFDHIIDVHPESVDILKEISDGSLNDISKPWEDDYEVYDDQFIRDNLQVEVNENCGLEENNYYLDEPRWNNFNNPNGEFKLDRNHNCESCGKSFKAASALKLHIRTVHEGHKDYTCISCGKCFPRLYHLKRHVKRVHEGKNVQIVEPKGEDSNDYVDKGNNVGNITEGLENTPILSSNERLPLPNFTEDSNPNTTKHKEKEDFVENIVIKSEIDSENDSNSNSMFQPELFLATGILYKEYKCETCGKSFSQKGGLKRHNYTAHEGHKDFKCDSCGKLFSSAQNLKTHIHAIHEGHKDYNCVICGKSFSQAGHLKSHLHSVHVGLKEHKCEHCGKSFSQPGVLKRHVATVHEKLKTFKCEICGKSFSQGGVLKKHINRIHEYNNQFKWEETNSLTNVTGDSNPNPTKHKKEDSNPMITLKHKEDCVENIVIKSEIMDDDDDSNVYDDSVLQPELFLAK